MASIKNKLQFNRQQNYQFPCKHLLSSMNPTHLRKFSLTDHLQVPKQVQSFKAHQADLHLQRVDTESRVQSSRKIMPSPLILKSYWSSSPRNNVQMDDQQYHQHKGEFNRKNQEYFLRTDRIISSVREMSVSNLDALDLPSSLYLLKRCISGCLNAKNVLGQTDFSLDYFKISPQGQIMTNINKIAKSKFKQTNEFKVIQKTIEEIKNIANNKFIDFCSYYQRSQTRQTVDFKYMLSLIKSYAKCAKIQLATRISEENFPKITIGKRDVLSSVKSQPNEKRFNSIDQFTSKNFYPTQMKKLKSQYATPTSNDYKISTNLNSPIQSEKNQSIESQAARKNQEISPQFSFSLGIKRKHKESYNSTSTHTKDSEIIHDIFFYHPSNKDFKELSPEITLEKQKRTSDNNISDLIEERNNEQVARILCEQNNHAKNQLKNENENSALVFETKIDHLFGQIVDLVSSYGTFSEKQFSEYSSLNTSQEHILTEIRKNGEKLFKQNCWTHNVHNLFSTEDQLLESITLNHSPAKNDLLNKEDFSKPPIKFAIKEILIKSKQN